MTPSEWHEKSDVLDYLRSQALEKRRQHAARVEGARELLSGTDREWKEAADITGTPYAGRARRKQMATIEAKIGGKILVEAELLEAAVEMLEQSNKDTE